MPIEPVNSSYTTPLAVVDREDDHLIVWHVQTGHTNGLSRLAGAWVLDASELHRLRGLITERPGVRCAPELEMPTELSFTTEIDADATVRAVRAEVAALAQRAAEHVANAKTRLVEPDWPDLPHPAEAKAVSPPDTRVTRALRMAHGFAELADAWAACEALRLTREYLIPLGGPVARPLPLEEIR
ncbi:hypothetical protein [Nocardia puris]|uniref:Uncharacterized protein n=1 Tax=Nocardia puris TaxID=208602 RepID=A0A366DQW4_9NOCA|nr:hypothetical protein [Nocardia puris]RBO92486.1 hypothetical protein DFR74_103129 [Nocardia puris]